MNDIASRRKTGGFDWSGTVKVYQGIDVGFQRSGNKHAVTVAEETVALVNRMAVGAEDFVAAGECADQHEQAGLREMKVSKERIDDVELEAWRNKDFSRTGTRREQ